MTKFGLGKGLGQLQTEMGQSPEISILAGGERVVVRNISVSQIAPNPDQPRKSFDASQLDDLANSIRAQGVLQPILLKKTGQGGYEIVAGERRWRAAKLAGLTEIPALVKELSDQNAAEIALIENVQRENLNAIEEGAAYQSLIDQAGYQISDISRLIGKSESYIRNIMRLSALPESVKNMVVSGELSASHARTLISSENPEKMAHDIIARRATVAETERLVKTTKLRQKAEKNIPADKIAGYERDLGRALGAAVKIRELRGGNGEIMIKFATRLQLQEIVDALVKVQVKV
jgi:ParB family chromosome partitioning protein